MIFLRATKHKQFTEQIRDRHDELMAADQVNQQIREAEAFLALNKDVKAAPYSLTIQIYSRTWLSIVWELACILDRAVAHGPRCDFCQSFGSGDDGDGNDTHVRMALKMGEDAERPKTLNVDEAGRV